ncbi:hypothetical protein DM01DRAFT_1316573 [Hesseltinella vesiculosa]|uniref:P-loop containing nucleoside triphosphate hydrolase protein n=1 Tax=Hesseltinella vesiculosa TaxID=101127 RepID=A0A1X2GUR2_9FUNG|nr:hypothetical protein DM01DRAFT_1316573 [Hesseltinella vesiculosa]
MSTKIEKQQAVSGDAFEDDFVIDDEINDDGQAVDEEDDDFEASNTDLKRKRETEPATELATASPPKKKNKKKKKSKDPFHGMKVWTEGPSVQADYYSDRLSRALPKLTALETNAIPASAFVDVAKFQYEHVLEELPKFVKFGVLRHKKLDKPPTQPGSPTAIVITHSAIRATDLVRSLKGGFGETYRVGKLFAKHIKVQEQAEFLKETAVHLVVGTPHRLLELAENGSLKLDNLELIVVDSDMAKGNYHLMDNLSCRQPFFEFLNTHVASRLQQGSTKLGIF